MQARAPAPSCGDCRYYAEHAAVLAGRIAPPGTVLRGLCRRYPAAVEKTGGQWCGEHRAPPPPASHVKHPAGKGKR